MGGGWGKRDWIKLRTVKSRACTSLSHVTGCVCVCVCVCVACLKDTTVVGDEAGWKSLGKSGKMLKE